MIPKKLKNTERKIRGDIVSQLNMENKKRLGYGRTNKKPTIYQYNKNKKGIFIQR